LQDVPSFPFTSVKERACFKLLENGGEYLRDFFVVFVPDRINPEMFENEGLPSPSLGPLPLKGRKFPGWKILPPLDTLQKMIEK